jgi:hypothetical protein
MTKHKGGARSDRGPAPEADRDTAGEVAGNARAKGGHPSPDDRGPGETPSAEPAPVDAAVHDRAS